MSGTYPLLHVSQCSDNTWFAGERDTTEDELRTPHRKEQGDRLRDCSICDDCTRL